MSKALYKQTCGIWMRSHNYPEHWVTLRRMLVRLFLINPQMTQIREKDVRKFDELD